MKPPEEYIKWLQSHPAVWEALQEEWEPQIGDWVWTGHEIGTLLGWDKQYPGHADVALCRVFRHHSWEDSKWSPETFHRYQLRWLPSLGQLVRMLVEQTAAGQLYFNMPTQLGEETGMYSTAAFRRDRPLIHYPLREGEKVYDYESVGDEPEIACTALWAKVKGVE